MKDQRKGDDRIDIDDDSYSNAGIYIYITTPVQFYLILFSLQVPRLLARRVGPGWERTHRLVEVVCAFPSKPWSWFGGQSRQMSLDQGLENRLCRAAIRQSDGQDRK